MSAPQEALHAPPLVLYLRDAKIGTELWKEAMENDGFEESEMHDESTPLECVFSCRFNDVFVRGLRSPGS